MAGTHRTSGAGMKNFLFLKTGISPALSKSSFRHLEDSEGKRCIISVFRNTRWRLVLLWDKVDRRGSLMLTPILAAGELSRMSMTPIDIPTRDIRHRKAQTKLDAWSKMIQDYLREDAE